MGIGDAPEENRNRDLPDLRNRGNTLAGPCRGCPRIGVPELRDPPRCEDLTERGGNVSPWGAHPERREEPTEENGGKPLTRRKPRYDKRPLCPACGAVVPIPLVPPVAEVLCGCGVRLVLEHAPNGQAGRARAVLSEEFSAR